jgi:transcriptional regulator with XRE-family HTH domain
MEEPFERLRRARERANLTGPAEAARKFGWNKETYKSHENGARGIRRSVAERYAKAFRVSAAWILTGEDESASTLSRDEQALVNKYRKLPPEGQRAIFAVADSYLSRETPPDTDLARRPLPARS